MQIKNIQRLIVESIAANRQLNATSLERDPTAHHAHVTGSRIPFFGSGTLFQGQADKALCDCLALVEGTIEGRKLIQKQIIALTPNFDDRKSLSEKLAPAAAFS